MQWGKDSLFKSGAGKTGQPLVKEETTTLSDSIHKNKFKMG